MESPRVNNSTVFKTLAPSGRAIFGGSMRWPLPVHGEPGAWVALRGTLRTCHNGLHLAVGPQVVEFLGPTLWVAEYDDTEDIIDAVVKVVARRARIRERVWAWTPETAWSWPLDIAEMVLPVFENECPGEHMARDAISLAREGDRWFAMACASDQRVRVQNNGIDKHADMALRAIYEACLWSEKPGSIGIHARRTAKCVISALGAFGVDRAGGQRMLFTWLQRYLNRGGEW